ncbi:MAG: RES domain-containing protein [Opitutaceae bacterium]|nr:RES domain-containing protein [Opitutaceae bacterium]
MITVYRLVKTARAHEAFTGEGARLFGGRWNAPGSRVVYTSATRSLALLETLVHVDASLPLPSFSFLTAALTPDDVETLPADAFARRDDLAHTRALGEAWLRAARHPALAVPSVIVPEETNYLLNPGHPRFAAISTSPARAFRFDQRLVPASATYPRVSPRRTP